MNDFGSAVASGDLTGDGVDDLIIGAPSVSTSTTAGVGRVYLVPGFH